MLGRLKTKSISLIRSMLKEGMSLKKMTLCIALGITLGIFPVLGMTTLLCALAAFALRLNMPAIQLVNYMVYPMQLVLLAPFYGAGSWLFGSHLSSEAGSQLVALLQNGFWKELPQLFDHVLYAVFVWLLLSPFFVLILYVLLLPVVVKIQSALQRGQSPRNLSKNPY